jgi:hypothetical protein
MGVEMSSPGRHGCITSLVVTIVGTVVAGLIVYQLTSCSNGGEVPDPQEQASGQSATPSRPQLRFLERVTGDDWVLVSWTEAGGPITLGLEVLDGGLEISAADGTAVWRMDIQPVNQPASPQPAIQCAGRTTLSAMIEGVPGGGEGGNMSIDWTAQLDSINQSTTGEDWIRRTLCGWATIGTRSPFAVVLEPGDDTLPADRMEMTNEYGSLRWSR